MTAKSRTTNREVASMGAASPRFRDLAVQIWPIDKLIPYARNARTHTDEQVAQVAASIIEFGWTNPILVGADGVIIAGHARLAAARKLKHDRGAGHRPGPPAPRRSAARWCSRTTGWR